MALDQLGTPSGYSARIHWRGGAKVFMDLPPAASLWWERVIDDSAAAQVVLPKPPLGSLMRDRLRNVNDWAHELSIYRDGPLVWQGPIQGVTESATDITLDAADVIAYLDRAPNQSTYDLTADLATVAASIISNGLTGADPNLLAYLQVSAAGIVGQRAATVPESVMAGDELRELAREGLDFTAIGRRILIGSQTAPAGRHLRLSNADLDGDVQVVRSGADTTTRAVVIGEGVRGVAGGDDLARGRLGRIVKADGTTLAAAANARAAAIVAAGTPPVVFVRVPDGVKLRPTARVTIEQLVPGAAVDVMVTDYCLPAQTTLRLTRVRADWDSRAESVNVTLAPSTTDTQGDQ